MTKFKSMKHASTEAPQKPVSLRIPLARLNQQFLRPYRLSFLICLTGLLIQSLLILPVPLLQGRILDLLLPFAEATEQGRPPIDLGSQLIQSIATGLALIVACQLLRTSLSWAVSNTMGRISQEVVVQLRSTLHQKLMRLPMAYFDAQQTGRLMARVTSDVGSILSFVNSGLLQLVNDLILALGIAALLFWLQWRLALIAMVVMPLYLLNQMVFSGKIRQLSLSIRSQVSSIYALLSERVSAVRVVRGCAQEAEELAQLDKRIDHHRELSWKNTRTSALLSLLATLITGLGTLGVLIGGILLIGQNQLTMGELLAFYSLIGQLYGPIVRLTQFQATAQSTSVSIERLCEVLDEPETLSDSPDAKPLITPQGAISLENIHFRYQPDSPEVITSLTLNIKPGTMLGIIGPSGAGKTTLLALIARLYDIVPPTSQGEVRFDGHNIRHWLLADLRKHIALVPQQALLFEGTILTNLTYACPDASEPEIKAALEITDLQTTINHLPNGLQTSVSERGMTLSGGQRQRLALARSIIAKPAVLLLDDCTSALDAETESRIQESLVHNLPGRTSVVVSQKCSSVRQADLIIVLDKGKIIEQGTHTELVGLGGWYSATFKAQTTALTDKIYDEAA
ncbi:MAG: ABC transporter ATP-binding protein [Planctomycetota bacterium]|nr:ABC transporter ATP-binding protein [Planctomycetota bacterium]